MKFTVSNIILLLSINVPLKCTQQSAQNILIYTPNV